VVGGEPVVGRRAVLLVANAAAPYSRGLRVARSLAAAGWSVEIAAVADDATPTAERDGPIIVRRYRPSGRWARFAHGRPAPQRRGIRGQVAGLADTILKVVAWPIHVRGWWSTVERDLPAAELYHAFGILAVPLALRLAERDRGARLRPTVVYDVIDVILESNNMDRLPGPIVAAYRWRERRWVRRTDAIVTVNGPIAEHLASIWPVAERPTVLLNCQPVWVAPEPRPDLIRAATGIPAERRIVLFLGRLGRERGLDEAAKAVLALDDVALVLLGFGPWADRLRERDLDARYVGRHFTLPPVQPDDVPAWTASADASIIAVPANSLNQRLSTPNKFWESLTAGTPVVVGRDLDVMRAIVEREGLGTVADPDDPADLARALRGLLDDAVGIAATRERCLTITRQRYNWEAAVEPYLALVARTTGGPGRRDPT